MAKRVETAGITSAGGFVGSFHYAAPEQVLGRATSAATDVYALTVVLYQCLTGAVPYARYAEAGALFAQVNEPPPSLSRTEARAFNDVIARGMAKDPADRYASAGELIVAAVRSLGELPSGRLRQRPVFLVGSGDGDRDFETERRTDAAPIGTASRSAPAIQRARARRSLTLAAVSRFSVERSPES